jgi:hypothetical protein
VHDLGRVGRVGTDSAGRLVVWGGGDDERVLVAGMGWGGAGGGREGGDMEEMGAFVEVLQALVEAL